MSDSFFIHPHNKKSISSIYAASVCNVNVDDCGITTLQQFHINVDKLDSRDLLV